MSLPCRRRHKGILFAAFAATAVALFGAAEGPPYRVGGEVVPPRKISGDQPVYTEAARRARIQGVAILEALIDERGEVTSARVLKGLPMGLDDAAVDAVKTWKFTPAMRRGEPVAVYFILTVDFRLTTDFDFGPAFSVFLRDHADVRALVEEGDYGEAGELIDRFLAEHAGDNSLLLGRAYMHLGANEVDEAWRVAQSVSGPEQAEIARSIAAKAAALLRANRGASDADRSETVEVGLPAGTLAAKLTTDDDPEGLAYALRTKAELLRAQAELVTDAARRTALRDEAKALDARADQLTRPGPILE